MMKNKDMCKLCSIRKASATVNSRIDDVTFRVCGTCLYNIRIFCDTGIMEFIQDKPIYCDWCNERPAERTIMHATNSQKIACRVCYDCHMHPTVEYLDWLEDMTHDHADDFR